MKWNGMEWNGLDWIGLDWIGMEWNELLNGSCSCVICENVMYSRHVSIPFHSDEYSVLHRESKIFPFRECFVIFF